jgi:trimethylamine--corrinoid protein Co-methyltransferase
MSLWGTMLAGTDFVLHAAGWLEGGLTASLEKLALDVEILRIFERMRQGIPTDDEAMAYDAIAEAGPGGMFLASPHTMNHFRDWLYMSPLFRTTDFAAWEQQGAPTGEREANAAWKRMLESYEDPGLDDGVRAELDAFVAKRKQEIPDFEE